MQINSAHLSYCTNIHAAETWGATKKVLQTHVLQVRERLVNSGELTEDSSFAIGLRLSAEAAAELLAGNALAELKAWLDKTNTYIFTINGFPYGNFHGSRVKEQVFLPDWMSRERLEYTKNLFRILSAIVEPGTSASVSSLPGSHKTFNADGEAIISHLLELADFLEELSMEAGVDFHLGLEPEPFGHFENTEETLAFFADLSAASTAPRVLARRIGINFDVCHFAIEYDDARGSLDAFVRAGIRISKIHLSNALALDPRDTAALAAIRAFDEPVYSHQTILRDNHGKIRRFTDLSAFFVALDAEEISPGDFEEMRVHFHIPLDAQPAAPLRSTGHETRGAIQWWCENPMACEQYEIETYTWAVLPRALQRPVEEQVANEYRWVLAARDLPSMP